MNYLKTIFKIKLIYNVTVTKMLNCKKVTVATIYSALPSFSVTVVGTKNKIMIDEQHTVCNRFMLLSDNFAVVATYCENLKKSSVQEITPTDLLV